MKKNSIIIVSAILGGFLSFLSVGIVWSGVNQWTQLVTTSLFLALGFTSSWKSKDLKSSIFSICVGAAPLGSLLVRFRDKNDSHILAYTIVATWVLAVTVGSYAGEKFRPK